MALETTIMVSGEGLSLLQDGDPHLCSQTVEGGRNIYNDAIMRFSPLLLALSPTI
jgi:hypothetical protein